ncbi:MAG: FlgD immunoglobulin-like domain containing protein [bacterium]
MKLVKDSSAAMFLHMAIAFFLRSEGLFAQNLVQAESAPSTTTAATGVPVTVDINIDLSQTSPAQLLGSFSGTLDWNTAVLSFVNHSGVKSGFTGVVGTNNTANGQLSFNGANAMGAGGKFNVLTCTFNAIGANGTSTALDLEFSAMAAALTFTNLIPLLSVTNGAVTIGTTRVEEDHTSAGIPATFALWQNHPNPFNPETEIKYELPREAHVVITIFNIAGQKIATLIDGRVKAGVHAVRWKGTDDLGRSAPSGIYICRMAAAGNVFQKRMALIK